MKGELQEVGTTSPICLDQCKTPFPFETVSGYIKKAGVSLDRSSLVLCLVSSVYLLTRRFDS